MRQKWGEPILSLITSDKSRNSRKAQKEKENPGWGGGRETFTNSPKDLDSL